jgi:trimethylamine:corrinoid methyltransferase-like protein
MRKLVTLLFLISLPAQAVPVVPNFSSGTMSAVTRTTSVVTETISSHDYNTGHTYTLNGSGITINGSISPDPTTVNQTINGTSYQWTGADLTNKPSVTLTTQGNPFQYVESYTAPGLSNITNIIRTTNIESTTETTSVFSQ